jgi:GT2 family glycosyltransferase
MILGTIVPNSYMMPFEAVKCWFNVLIHGYNVLSFEGSTLSNNRNQVFNRAKELGDSLLFIDSDIVFKPEDVERMGGLLKVHDIVCGVYSLTFPPYNPTIFKRVENDYEFMPIPKELTEIGACGGGFMGISKYAMEKLGENPFTNQWEGMVQHGEDVSFCHYAREKGLKIWCDPNIQVGQVRISTIYPKNA